MAVMNIHMGDLLKGGLTDMDSAWLPVGLHPVGCVHSVSKQTVARHLLAYHTSHHRPSVDPNTDLNTA